MANELKLAKAAREIAGELSNLADKASPFEVGHAFWPDDKSPCCVVGHVIQRAGLKALVMGRPDVFDGTTKYRSSADAISDVCGVEVLDESVNDRISDVVCANDGSYGNVAVAGRLQDLADALELSVAPKSNEEL